MKERKPDMKKFLLAATVVFFSASAAGSVMAANFFAPAAASPAPTYHLASDLKSLFGGGGAGKLQKQHEIHDDKTFEALTTVHTISPFERTDIFFTISLPKDWTADLLPEGKRDISSGIIGDLARFSSPMIGTKKLRVYTQAVSVEHDISVDNWLKNYILTSGFAPDGNVIADPENPRRAAIYFVNLEGGDSFYNYMAAELSGNIMMLSRFQVPQDLKEYAAFLQKKAIDSFALTYPSESPIEERKTFAMMDALKLDIPLSWETVSPNFRDMNRLSVQLHNKSSTGNIDGFILVQAIRRHRATNLLKELDELKKYFDTSLNVDISEMISSTEPPRINPRFIFKRYEVYHIENRRKSQSKQDAHVVVLGDKEWYVIIFLITMREDERLYTWARNVKTFENIIETIR